MRVGSCLIPAVLTLTLLGCSEGDDPASESAELDASAQDAGSDSALPAEDAAQEAANDASAADAPPGEASLEDAAPDALAPRPVATIQTSFGAIRVELDDGASPVTVDNFRKYADAAYYDGLLFHRVIPDFMIQGGGLEPGMVKRPTLFPPIVNEASSSGLSNLRGTIAMARTSNPDSATSQFFINTADNTFLDPGQSDPAGYAVFGKVIDGMDVVELIEDVTTHSVGIYDDVPVEDVVIQSIRVNDE